jgi:hypothetical protein
VELLFVEAGEDAADKAAFDGGFAFPATEPVDG